jgi:hypothetical protein
MGVMRDARHRSGFHFETSNKKIDHRTIMGYT